jgi:hypothetical protein
MSETHIPSGDTPQHSDPSTPENQNHTACDEEKHDQDRNDEEALYYERNYVSGIARWLILGPVTLTYFTFFLDLAVLSTATPAITSDFNSLTDIGW